MPYLKNLSGIFLRVARTGAVFIVIDVIVSEMIVISIVSTTLHSHAFIS